MFSGGMNKETEILNTVKIRKISYLGHIMRHPEKYELPILILQGKIAGKRGVGRRRISWLKNLRQWFNINTAGLFHVAVNKGHVGQHDCQRPLSG